jgi:DsbC/DsbD-like thiol-disulfide interchange protein
MTARALLLLVALAASSDAAARAVPSQYMDAALVADTAAPEPGRNILVGFRFTPKPGWHGYWSNPGDSGIAPTVRWTVPEGVSFGPLLHPAPTLISADGIDSFVHEGPHVLLSRMTLARSVAPGTPIPVKADLSWAACTATQCVPLRATFTLDLVAGDAAGGPDAALLRAAALKLPRPATGATFAVEGSRLRLHVPESLNLDAKRTRFFPDEGGYFDSGAAQSAADSSGSVLITAPLEGKAPRLISGVVSDGRRSYRMTFAPAPASAGADEPDATQPETPATEHSRTVDLGETSAGSRSVASSSPEQEQQRRTWPWLLIPAIVAIACGSWAWRRRAR